MNNLRTPPKFLQKPSPYFFMVHLLHRLYGVDAPAVIHAMRPKMLVANEIAFSSNFSFLVKKLF